MRPDNKLLYFLILLLFLTIAHWFIIDKPIYQSSNGDKSICIVKNINTEQFEITYSYSYCPKTFTQFVGPKYFYFNQPNKNEYLYCYGLVSEKRDPCDDYFSLIHFKRFDFFSFQLIFVLMLSLIAIFIKKLTQ